MDTLKKNKSRICEVQLIRHPGPGFYAWEFRVLEIHPKPYATCEFFTLDMETTPTPEDVNNAAWEALPDPSTVSDMVFSPYVISKIGDPP